jgi:hypothetical protein|nr:MAG TPA: hypothetical protein [Caudoviricetes sp.]
MKKYLYYENDTIILISDKKLDYLGDNFIFEEEPEFVENAVMKINKDKKPYYKKVENVEERLKATEQAMADLMMMIGGM